MIKWIQKRLQEKEEGFTLIELMVVVLIIAILIAIAIPTFLGARGRAQDRAAQSSLRNTVTAAKAIFTDNEDYTDATQAALESAEPAITFVLANVASDDPPNEVSVDGDDGAAGKSTAFVAAGKSANGDKCWYVTDRVNPSSNPGTWWAVRNTPGSTNCTADFAQANITSFPATPAAGSWARQPGKAILP